MLVGWKKGAGAEAAIEKGWNEDICGLCNTSIGGGFPRWGGGGGGTVQPSSLHNLCPSSRAQREQIEKERLEEEKKATGRLQHANELRRQVRENQQKQVQDRIATFEEGRRLREEAQRRHERIEDIKKKKIEELRCGVIPSSPAPLPFPKEMAWQTGKLEFRDQRGVIEVLRDVALLRGLQQKALGLGSSWSSGNCLAGCWGLDGNMFEEWIVKAGFEGIGPQVL